MLNIFIGIVISTFNREEIKISKKNLINDFQQEWLKQLNMVLKTKPLVEIESKHKFRKYLLDLAKSKKFDNFIAGCLIANIVVLCVKWHDMPEDLEYLTDVVNEVFGCIFIIEAVIKILGFRGHYFKSVWNRIDLFIVAIGLTRTTIAVFKIA